MGSLFGSRPVGAVPIVETPLSQWYARRARIAFLTVSVAAAVVTTAVLGVLVSLPIAVVVGVAGGVVCGLVAGALVRVWPVLRVLSWWSIEIIVATLVVVGPSTLARAGDRWLVLVLLLMVVGLCLLVHPLRRWLAAWSLPVRGRGARSRADACWTPVAGGLTPHGLRHSHKTLMQELGVPAVLQDERMGHEDGSVQARYSHVTAAMRRQLLADLTVLWDGALDARRELAPRSSVTVLDRLLGAGPAEVGGR